MKKKIILVVIFIIIFFSLFILYLNSNNNNDQVEEKKQTQLIEKENTETIDEKIESSNIIEDVSYSAKDTEGNEYFLTASEGTIDQNESNYIFLKFVKANINLKN